MDGESKMDASKISDKVVQFLVSQLGGEQKVLEQYRRSQLAGLEKNGAKIGDLIDQAVSEGWIDWLRELSMDELTTVSAGKTIGKEGRASSATSRSEAIRAGATLRARILDFLDHSPSSKAKEIRVATDTKDPLKVTLALRTLRRQGLVQMHGTGKNCTYSLVK